MKYTVEDMELLAKKLRSMPKIEKKQKDITKQDAITALAKEISEMQKRGYTLEQIAETISGEGLAITTPTLKSYLQRSKATKTSDNSKPLNVAIDNSKKKAEATKSSFDVKQDTREI
jgi:predicted  nucleic acid-binding Zn-ribbon protein